ncbi:cytochrome c [Pelagovum sp. HNIBRBA483]|uniref:c-type cytochrome n=1 Tax=Pelagovum sp. HNIBRBA483 TaxID=3233341 RepID=UPI0034A16D24
MRALQLFLVLLGVSGLAYWFTLDKDSQVALVPDQPTSAIVEIVVPETLSANAQVGKVAFEAKCSACHGANAVGQTDIAPPLVHKIYEPSHHADEAFQRAVALGVRQHHWPFGNMAPVEGLTRADVTMIVAYVRELQRANGIN